MPETLRHVSWERWDEDRSRTRGLVAVRTAGCETAYERVELKTLSGHDLPVGLLLPVLSAALPDDWMADAERLHQSRKSPWPVKRRIGMSGCRDYTLYYLRNEALIDQPRAASLHVSMSWKLNEGLRLWMGDLPPLLAVVIQDFPPITKNISFRVYEPLLEKGYNKPGADSGLQAVLDSLKAMEVMAV